MPRFARIEAVGAQMPRRLHRVDIGRGGTRGIQFQIQRGAVQCFVGMRCGGIPTAKCAMPRRCLLFGRIRIPPSTLSLLSRRR